NGWSLLVHLKMTGQLVYVKKTVVIPARSDSSETRRANAGIQDSGSPRIKYGASLVKPGMTNQKHTHVIFNFTDGSRLLFNDLRQFGYLKVVKSAQLPDYFLREGFGPEPLNKDFTLADFERLLKKKSSAKIKQFLMDQKNLAGIGNIYSDEILFFAGVNPLRRIAFLKYNEIKKIYRGIKKILPEAIKLKGTSANNYLDAFGQKGKFALQLKVYGREGKKCVKCKGQVARIKINGRSAHFCPACQK
ncbi:hypothetical protein KJ590_03440, partial [Patescibacteria group bacterium]|nr:hypothetical protein [Patescibacteria group bacterium]